MAEQRLGSPCGQVRVEPPVRAGSIATGRPRPLLDVWLFLQPGNSQFSNCQIRNTRISTEAVTRCSESWGRATSVLPKPISSPVPPVLSGAHQARFSHSSSRCFRYLHPNNSHGSSSPNRPAQPIGAFLKRSTRREHCGNFSVAYIVMRRPRLSNWRGITPP